MFKKCLTVLILSVIIFTTTTYTFAVTESELKKEQQEIQDNIDDAQKELEQVEGEMNKTMKQLKELNSSISKSQTQLDELNDQITSLNKELKEINEKLDETQEEFNKQEAALKARITAQYKSGTVSYLDVLLNSKGIIEFVSNYYILTEMVENDTELLESIEQKKKEIEENKTKLETKKADLKVKKAEADKISVTLKNQKVQKSNYYEELSEQEKEIQKKLDQYAEDERKISQEIANFQKNNSGSTNIQYTGGKLLWPVPGHTRITSGFGNRTYKINGVTVSDFHRGIDIGAPKGTKIVAAEDAVVVKAQTNPYVSSYGKYVTLYHGGSLYTVYAHCSALNVSVGQKVSAGQVIAYIGSTGNSTGNHLHFEVQEGGALKSPLTYVSK